MISQCRALLMVMVLSAGSSRDLDLDNDSTAWRFKKKKKKAYKVRQNGMHPQARIPDIADMPFSTPATCIEHWLLHSVTVARPPGLGGQLQLL